MPWPYIIWILVCALANRVRGGLWGDAIRERFPFWGTTIGRLMTTAVMSLPFALHGTPLQWCGMWILLYVGFIFGWKAWQAVTNIPHDIWCLSLRGALLTGLMGMVWGSIPLALSGAAMGPLYFLGKYLPSLHEQLDENTEWGEILFGGWLGFWIMYASI